MYSRQRFPALVARGKGIFFETIENKPSLIFKTLIAIFLTLLAALPVFGQTGKPVALEQSEIHGGIEIGIQRLDAAADLAADVDGNRSRNGAGGADARNDIAAADGRGVVGRRDGLRTALREIEPDQQYQRTHPDPGPTPPRPGR